MLVKGRIISERGASFNVGEWPKSCAECAAYLGFFEDGDLWESSKTMNLVMRFPAMDSYSTKSR